MEATIDLHQATRTLLVKSLESLDLEQVNLIPTGFNNSIAWNTAHIIVTQQLLTYKLSGREMLVEDSFVERFRKGTRAESSLSAGEWADCKKLLLGLAQELERDYFEEKFSQYTTYPTSYGYEIHSIEEAIQFNNIHEALHLGYIMSMKRAIGA
ncbi:MAG: hypothetical protein ACI9O4_001181 [Chitinophagales bacterium]